MTINSEWVKILKTNATGAFSPKLPSNANIRTVFIDGQIKLMKSNYVQCWNQFVRLQFINYIEETFSRYGNEICVLGFDNYDYVPEAKGPTQRLRNKTKVQFKFEDDTLPTKMPYDWGAAMRNRTFKTKVIAYVIHEVRRHFQKKLTSSKKTVIIDFKPQLQIFGYVPENNFFKKMQDYCSKEARGECDIKAFDWIHYGPVLMMSTDGDYIPIALLQQQTDHKNNDIYIHRMAVKCSKGEKRSVQGAKKQEYEFVNISRLKTELQTKFDHISLEDLIACIALSGCDFAMNLPLIGPQKIWNILNSKDSPSHLCNVKSIEALIVEIYAEKFAKSSFLKTQNYTIFVQKIKQISKAEKHISMLWTQNRLNAHCKNVLWTMQYWKNLSKYPDALQIDQEGNSVWGFVKNKNVIVFDGQTLLN